MVVFLSSSFSVDACVRVPIIGLIKHSVLRSQVINHRMHLAQGDNWLSLIREVSYKNIDYCLVCYLLFYDYHGTKIMKEVDNVSNACSLDQIR